MENRLSFEIIGAALEVQTVLGGPGLLESIYEAALFHELKLRGLSVQKQLRVDVSYKEKKVHEPLILDLLVENRVIVEVKAMEQTHRIHQAQLLTYLRMSDKRLGLLINFGISPLKDGIIRVVNKLVERETGKRGLGI